MANELTYKNAVALVSDMAKALADPDLQAELAAAWEAAGDNKGKQAKARSEMLMPLQSKIITKYGYEASQKGMVESTVAFKAWNHIPEIHALNGQVSYYNSPAYRKEYPTVEDWLSKAWGPPPPPDASAKSKPFTLENAIALQEALIAGYSTETYQENLKQLVADSGGDAKKLRTSISNASMEMVQSKVLPSFGFEPSKKGVMLSMTAFNPYNLQAEVFKNNQIMQYLITPELHGESLEDYLQKAMETAAAAARSAQAASAAPAQRPAYQSQVPMQAAEPSRPAQPRVPAQVLKENMRKVGKSTGGVQRVDAQGQNAGWAPDEFIDAVVEGYEHGTYLTETGHFSEAEPLLREAMQSFAEVVGEGHPYTLLCANQLCFTLHQMGRFAEGEPIGKNAVEGFKRSLGNKHEHTVAAMNNYALCCQGNSNMVAAVEILKEALPISEQVNGIKHHATIAILSNLAETVRLEGENAEAEGMFRRCYQAEAGSYGADSLPCSMFANNLAVCLRDQDKNDEAKYWYERAIAGLTKYYGKDHEKVALVVQNYSELTSDPNPMPVDLPRFLMVEPRKPEEHFYKADEQFIYKPMCNFPSQASKDFGKRLQPIAVALQRG